MTASTDLAEPDGWHDPIRRRSLVLAALGAAAVSACGGGGGSGAAQAPADPTLSTDFRTGADVSLLALMEARGQVYRGGGVAEDVLTTFRQQGCSLMRLRLWVNPSGDDIYVNDLAYTVALAKRIKAAGHDLLLDIHYSDTWADPGKQFTPAAWSGLALNALAAQVRSYTADVIATLRDADVMPDIVQIGNETIDGMLWPAGQISKQGWGPYAALVKAGIAGVKDGAADGMAPKIMLHIDRGADWPSVQWFFDNIAAQGVAFDLIGLSFYPEYHGPIDGAKTTLTNTANRYDKGVMVVETGYPFEGNWRGAWLTHEVSPNGQRQFLIDLVAHVRSLPKGRGRGVLFWAPEWLPGVGLGSDWGQKTLYADDGEVLPAVAGLGGLLDPWRSYRLVNRASGLALEVPAAALTAGVPLVQAAASEATHQQWRVASSGSGDFAIRARHSALLLDGVAAAGGDLQAVQATAQTGTSQQWDVLDAGQGHFIVLQRASGLVLDTDGATAPGTPVYLRSQGQALPQQQWKLVPVS